MATTTNIVIEQGATFSQEFIVKDSAGSAKDLTGYTATAQIRRSYYSSTATDFTTAIVAGDGKVTLSLTAAETAAISVGSTGNNRYVYDLEVASSSETLRPFEGIVTVRPNVTRA